MGRPEGTLTTEASVPRTIGSTGRGGLRLLHKDALSLKVTAVDLRQSDPISARAEDVQSSLIPLNRGRHACESSLPLGPGGQLAILLCSAQQPSPFAGDAKKGCMVP